MKYDIFHGHDVPDLENEPTLIGDFVFARYKGSLYVLTKEEYDSYKYKDMLLGLEYYPVDHFADVIDALNYYKENGLEIKLEAEDFAKLVESATYDDRMETYVSFNRYDFIKDYGAFRRLVLIRDDYKCLCCGNDNEKDLQVHHIRSFKDNLELATSVKNGVTLCKDCHKKYHKKYGWNGKQETFSKFINEMLD